MTALYCADVAIVGAGPAGITLALELNSSGLSVVLLPGGARRETAKARSLNAGGPVLGPWHHEPLEENRRRMIGGASSVWRGRCVPFDPIDFSVREWIPASGWPISYQEYWRWAARACEILQVGQPDFCDSAATSLLPSDSTHRTGEPKELEDTSLERWSPPLRFARLLRQGGITGAGCRIIDGASATRIEWAGARVDSVVGRDLQSENEVRLRAKAYVLAAGALENARLLLTSGVNRDLKSVGRYYMAHLFGTMLPVRLDRPLPASTGFRRDAGVYVRRRFALSDEMQKQHQVGNAIAAFGRPPPDRLAEHRDPMTSAIELARTVNVALRAGPTKGRSHLRNHSGHTREQLAILREADPAFWRRASLLTLKRLARNGLPILVPERATAVHYFSIQSEHAPNPSSQVFLGDEVDALGVPRLATHIDFSEVDFRTVDVLYRALARAAIRSGGEALRPAESIAHELREHMRKSFTSNAHHIGTTRMGLSKLTSVVNGDCRVHTVDNLYVAGSGVFPTSGHANPTLSIVMLACRLAEHLKRCLG